MQHVAALKQCVLPSYKRGDLPPRQEVKRDDPAPDSLGDTRVENSQVNYSCRDPQISTSV